MKILSIQWRFYKKLERKKWWILFFEVDVQNPEELNRLYNGLPYLPKWVKIGKVKKLISNLHGKTEYVIYRTIKSRI